MNTTPSTTTQPVETDEARRVVGEALRQYADASGTAAPDADLALAMAANVVGWTHTTRLRDFLEQVTR